MRLTIIILLFQMVSCAQNINGKWKLISYEDEKMYYNVQNDSISPKDYWDEDDEMSIILKKAFKDTNIEFTENKHFIMKSHIVGHKNSKFKIDTENKLIILDELDINNEKIFYHFNILNDIFTLNLADDIILKFRRN